MARLADSSVLSVGTHKVTTVKFLSEGGFSQIYEVKMDPPEGGSDIGCLKQVIVPDKSGLNTLRKEVDVMKILRKARNIVRYYDLNAERLADGSYQVLVLMELCPNQLLLDYMNTRIRLKLAEAEILKIMLDITVGLYEMHRLKLVHRDIKIENVLIDAHNVFKLCDFGSVAAPIRPPRNQQEFQALSHDILYQTTPQYRAPEMVDLYRGFPIDEKADIWALGCFLYKLCYYTTPFEANGDIAILHASFQFLPAPAFSGDLKNLIIIMLQENPVYRPNVVQILMLLCRLQHTEFSELNIEDFYQAGEYNFQALHEMQKQKQNELLKQQQYYYEQQKQQFELQKSQHGSQVNLTAPLTHTGAPTPVAGIPAVDQQSAHNEKRPAELVKAAQRENIVAAESKPVLIEGSPAVIQHGQFEDSSQLKAHEERKDVPLIVEPISQKLVSSGLLNSDPGSDFAKSSEEDSDVDLAEFANLEDAEVRYPSLDAFDVSTATGGMKTLDPISKVKSAVSVSAQSPRLSFEEPRTQRKPSEFESKEAWEKRATTIDKKAEILVEDIFTRAEPQQAPERMSPPEAKSAPLDIMPEAKKDEHKTLEKSPGLVSPDPRTRSAEAKKYPIQRVPAIDSAPLASAFIPKPQPVYLLSSYNVGKSQHAERRESSNPWGDVLRQKTPAFETSTDYDLAQHVANVSLDDHPHKLSAEIDRNLIDLEVGLSSSSSGSDVPPPLPPHPVKQDYARYEEVSLLDMDIDEKKKTSTLPVFKKKIAEVLSQLRLDFREEVIDFASDDENTNSEMSRMAIRNSLRKPKSRKLSEYKRSESTDSRKRLSFFGNPD